MTHLPVLPRAFFTLSTTEDTSSQSAHSFAFIYFPKSRLGEDWVEKQQLLAPTQYHANTVLLLPDLRMKVSAFHCDTAGTFQAVSEAQEQLPALRYAHLRYSL